MRPTGFLPLVLALAMVYRFLPTIQAQSPSSVSSALSGESILALYQEVSGRTLLRPATLPNLREVTVESVPKDTHAAMTVLVQALTDKDIGLVEDGSQFVLVFPKGWMKTDAASFWKSLPRPSAPAADSSKLGAVTFNANLSFVLDIYAEVSGRSVLYPVNLPDEMLYLKSRNPLSPAETTYAMETLMALNGLAALHDGSHFTQLVPIQATNKVRLAAPAPREGAPVLDPKKIPATVRRGGVPSPALRTQDPSFADQVGDELTKLYLKAFGNQPPWQKPAKGQAEQLLEFYGDLTGKKVQAGSELGSAHVAFRLMNPLTKEELIYAVETVLRLNNLILIPAEGNAVRLGHISELASPED